MELKQWISFSMVLDICGMLKPLLYLLCTALYFSAVFKAVYIGKSLNTMFQRVFAIFDL